MRRTKSKAQAPPTFDDVRRVGLELKGAEASSYYAAPALKVRGDMFVCMASHRSAEPGSLVVRMEFADRDALIAERPDLYYLKPHYVGYPCVVARLGRLDRDTLSDLVRMAWRYVTSRDARLVPRADTRRARRPAARARRQPGRRGGQKE